MKKRNTQQKQIVAACLREMGHPSASALYRRVQEEHPEISRATVFRILKERAEAGEALRLSVGDGEDRYDATTCLHYHVRCTSCGRVDDVATPEAVPAAAFTDSESGYLIEGFSLIFHGLCPTCRDRQTSSIKMGEMPE